MAQGTVGQIPIKSSVFVKEAPCDLSIFLRKNERLRSQRLIVGNGDLPGPCVQSPDTWSSALGSPLHPMSLTFRGGSGAGEGGS